MPYDTHGRWVPPDDAEGDWANWDRMSTRDFQRLIQSGQLAGVGLADMAAVRSRFNTEDWRSLNDTDKLGVLQEYQRVYGFMSESTRFDDQWGLDLERLEDREDWVEDPNHADKNHVNVRDWFFHHSDYKGRGHEIDFANYNEDYLYQAARQAMISGTPEQKAVWTGDIHDQYENVTQLRTAADIIKGWDAEEREVQMQWAKDNVQPYNETDAHIRMFQQTQKFDPVSKTMYTYENIRKEGAIDPTNLRHNALTIKQWLPPAPPTSLNIVKGNAPTPTVNADGTRIANADDITGWYRQYLDREPDAEGLAHWLNDSNNGKSFEWIQGQIMNSQEASNKGNKDFGATYYNPEAYGSEASITAKLVDEPAQVQAPSITIRSIGEPKKPTRSYMALNDTVWTDSSVDTRSTRWDASKGKRVSTGKPRKDASFPTEAPVKGGT